jgi:hypothetical protein
MRIQGFLNGGYDPDIIKLGVIEALRRKSDGPPTSFAYFDKAIAAARARAERPLPKVIDLKPQEVAVREDNGFQNQGNGNARYRNGPGGFALNEIEFERRAANAPGSS